MRSSVLFTAAFAAVALATPVFDKRGEVVVTDNEVVYVTQLVTVTEGAVAPADATPAPAYTPWYRKKGFGRKGRKTRTRGGYGQAPAPSSDVPAPAPTSYEQPAPPPTTKAPAPAPTSYEQPKPAPSTSQAAPAPTGYNPPSGGTDYASIVVRHHNYHRANYSSPDIKWSDSLAATAQKIANTCIYKHNMDMDGGGYGQNIAAGQGPDKIASIISDQFYNGEVNAYDRVAGQANPDMSNFGAWGHLSQIVWASTTEVACATVDCSKQGGLKMPGQEYSSGNSESRDNIPGFYTVCNYKVAGNMAGAYAKNIGQCKGLPTKTGDDF